MIEGVCRDQRPPLSPLGLQAHSTNSTGLINLKALGLKHIRAWVRDQGRLNRSKLFVASALAWDPLLGCCPKRRTAVWISPLLGRRLLPWLTTTSTPRPLIGLSSASTVTGGRMSAAGKWGLREVLRQGTASAHRFPRVPTLEGRRRPTRATRATPTTIRRQVCGAQSVAAVLPCSLLPGRPWAVDACCLSL